MSKDLNYKELANKMMFDLSDEEVLHTQEEFATLLQQLQLLENIDTDGVEAMVYPFSEETSFMREDVIADVLSQEDVLCNAKRVKEGHVHVPKVVRS